MNTPIIETERLILRKFMDSDMEALFLILKDGDVNQRDMSRDMHSHKDMHMPFVLKKIIFRLVTLR